MLRYVVLLLIAGAALAQAPTPWDRAVSEFYRLAARASALRLQAHLADDAVADGVAKLQPLCDGTVEGIQQLQVTCKAK